MGLAHTVFRTGGKPDFERMLDDILASAKTAALTTSTQVEHESATRGTLLSSGTPIIMEQRLTPIHEAALTDAMRLIVQFSERTGIPILELNETARSEARNLYIRNHGALGKRNEPDADESTSQSNPRPLQAPG